MGCDLVLQISATNSLDLELHSLASSALAIRRRAYDEVPAAIPLKKEMEDTDEEKESWSDSFVAVYGDMSSINKQDSQGASCARKDRAHSSARDHRPSPPQSHDPAVGAFTALLTALQALYQYEPMKQSSSSGGVNGDSPHPSSGSANGDRRPRTSDLRPTFFSYTAEELKAVEIEI